MDSKYNISLNNGTFKGKFVQKRSKNGLSPKKKKMKLNDIESANIVESTKKVQQISPVKASTKISILDQRRKLPAFAVKRRLLEEIKKNDSTIIIGETGSGKTTQIPQMIHEARLEGAEMIGVTQPRRVAAITIALRVAQEMNTTVGEIVGYTVRFEDMTSYKTKVKYMTDGMLLREAMIDPLLKAYSFLIIDEAHERTVNTDVLFGIIKQAQKNRIKKNLSKLKVIVMSATMNVDIFSSYLDNCPVIYLEGRTYPVTVFYMKNKSNDYQHTALCTIFQIHRESPNNHDILVFLTGQEEIENLAYNIRQISKEINGNIRVCPLFAGLPPAQQLEAWRPVPSNIRKVVLATNIAETSITIPNIKYVIDTGVVKSRRYCSTTGAEFLRVESCSQAACWQRTGRAGRDSPGKCYRLYTADHFANMSPYTQPDILRCPLAPIILQMLALGIDPENFDMIDKPPDEAVQGAIKLLKQLGAVQGTDSLTLTSVGKKMSIFPIDPKFSKILLNGPEFGCLDEVLSIIAVLSSDGIFHCPMSKREEASLAKNKFVSPLGDHITLLNVYKAFCNAPFKKQWCRENYLNFRNLTYAQSIREQLTDLCVRQKLQISSCNQNYEQVLKCFITGLYVNSAWVRNTHVNGGGRYTTATGMTAAIHPSSVLHGLSPAPRYLLYTELISTQRTYISAMSVIEVDWLYQIVPEFARKCRIMQ